MTAQVGIWLWLQRARRYCLACAVSRNPDDHRWARPISERRCPPRNNELVVVLSSESVPSSDVARRNCGHLAIEVLSLPPNLLPDLLIFLEILAQFRITF